MDCRKCKYFRKETYERYFGECQKWHVILGLRQHCIDRDCGSFKWAYSIYEHKNCSNCKYCVSINKEKVLAVCVKKAKLFRADKRYGNTELHTCDDWKGGDAE